MGALTIPFGTPKPVTRQAYRPSSGVWLCFDIRPPDTDNPMPKWWHLSTIQQLNPGANLMDMQSVTQKLAAQSLSIRRMTFSLGIFDMVASGDKSFVVSQVQAAGYEIIQDPPPAEKHTEQGTITLLQFKLPSQQNMVDSYITVIRRIDGAAHVQQGKIISISNLVEDRVYLAFKDGKPIWYDLSAAITPEPHESLYSVESQYGVHVGDDWLAEKKKQAESITDEEAARLEATWEAKVTQEEIASLSSPDGAQPIDLDDYVAAVYQDEPQIKQYRWGTLYGAVEATYAHIPGDAYTTVTFKTMLKHPHLNDTNTYEWQVGENFIPYDEESDGLSDALYYFTEHPDDGEAVSEAIHNFEHAIANLIIERLEAELTQLKQRGTIVPARGAGQIVSSIDVIYKGQSGVMETRFIPKSSPSRTRVRDVIPVSQTIYQNVNPLNGLTTPELDLVPSSSEAISFTEAIGLLQEGKLTDDEVAKIGNAEARNNFVSSMMSRRAVRHD